MDRVESRTQPVQSDAEPGEPRLAVWEYAGLLVTYWCNARCAFCYVYSGPDRGGALPLGDALAIWSDLDEVARRAGKSMRIHLAGGEPFGDWPRLLSIVRAARDAGLSSLEKIETNAYWATHDGLTRARLEQLDALGMEKLVISADVYHQEFVPPECVERCVRIARQVLGRGRVTVRWWDFHNSPRDLRHLSRAERAAAYAAALQDHADRMTGRAADRLTPLLERHPPEAFRAERCGQEVLQSRHVHVDPYGNVFPGVCNGIILGNAIKRGIVGVWQDVAAAWRDHPVVEAVVHGGSYALYERAVEQGYVALPGGYSDKCHLCQHVRQFLVERGGWEQWLGPRECYASARDLREAGKWHVELTRQAARERAKEPRGNAE